MRGLRARDGRFGGSAGCEVLEREACVFDRLRVSKETA